MNRKALSSRAAPALGSILATQGTPFASADVFDGNSFLT